MTDNKENDNSTLIILTIFFSIFLVCVVSVFVFYRIKSLSKNNDDNKPNTINKEENTNVIYFENNNFMFIISKLEDSNFIELMMSKNNINEINNNELLYYLIKVTESQSQFGKIDNVPINVINDIHKDSLFNNYNFNHDNIVLNNKLLWVYNKNSNIYVKNNIDKDINIIPIFVRLDEINISDSNEYKLSYKYGFKNINDNNIYGSYIDCLNKKNPVYLDNTNNIEVLKQNLNQNYNNIKDKLNTYNYIIEVNNNSYTLKDFYIGN